MSSFQLLQQMPSSRELVQGSAYLLVLQNALLVSFGFFYQTGSNGGPIVELVIDFWLKTCLVLDLVAVGLLVGVFTQEVRVGRLELSKGLVASIVMFLGWLVLTLTYRLFLSFPLGSPRSMLDRFSENPTEIALIMLVGSVFLMNALLLLVLDFFPARKELTTITVIYSLLNLLGCFFLKDLSPTGEVLSLGLKGVIVPLVAIFLWVQLIPHLGEFFKTLEEEEEAPS